MSDLDQTIVSKGGSQQLAGEPPLAVKKRSPLLIIGGIRCALFLCLVLLIGGGLWFAGDQLQGLVAGLGEVTDTPTLPATVETIAGRVH